MLNVSNQLDEVIIQSKKKIFEKKVDRLVFNVQNLTSAIGGNAVDILKITPRLRIIDDQISMVGKSQMNIMVNNKIIPLTGDGLTSFLNSISSDNIKQIEVITNPPSKYNASGNSGIINIIYKKGVADSWSGRVTSTYIQRTYATGSLGGNFNYNKGKVSIASNLFLINGSRLIIDSNTISFSNQIWENISPRRVFYKPLLSGRFSFNYRINEKIDLGFQYLGNHRKIAIEQTGKTLIKKSATELNERIESRSSSISNLPAHSLNLNNTISLDSLGKKIILNLDYFSNEDIRDRESSSIFFQANNSVDMDKSIMIQNTGNQLINNYSGKIDVELPLKTIDFEFGGRLSQTKTNNDNNAFDLSSGSSLIINDRTNLFQFTENISAVYLSAERSYGEK